MTVMEILILAALVALIILLGLMLLKGRSEELAVRLDASLKEQFLGFQDMIHQSLSNTREEVARSKDLLSQHTVKTLDTIREMEETIQRIVRQQEESQRLGQSLKDLLEGPKLRGSYGEAILEEMLDRVLPKGVWERQYSIDGTERVDAVVRFRDVVIPVDAKFPREAYRRYVEAEDKAGKVQCWKEYEAALKAQIVSINRKYIRPEKGTAEFALMFLPSEAIYYETIAEKNSLGQPSRLYDFAQQHNVIPVGPNTFYAFLQVLIMGIRNLEIVRGARRIQEGLCSLQRSFDLFFKRYEEIGKAIEKASEAYRLGQGHIERYRRQLTDTLMIEALRDQAGKQQEGSS